MTIAFQDSEEKQRIREELWRPVVESCFKTVKNIRYLTLPGPECFELIKFLDLKILKLENIISIERDVDFFGKIQQFYAKEIGIHTDKIKDNIYNNELKGVVRDKNFWDRWKDFHIINLDLYGCPFDMDSGEESWMFNLFDDIIAKQSRDHNILVTVKLDAPMTVGMTKKPTMKVVMDDMLSPFAQQTNNEMLLNRINTTYDNKNEWLKIYAIILNMINQSERRANISLVQPPYTYIGISAGKTTRMLSYAVKVTYTDERPMTVAKRNQKTIKLLSEAIILIENTVWIN